MHPLPAARPGSTPEAAAGPKNAFDRNDPRLGGERAEIFSHPLQVATPVRVDAGQWILKALALVGLASISGRFK